MYTYGRHKRSSEPSLKMCIMENKTYMDSKFFCAKINRSFFFLNFSFFMTEFLRLRDFPFLTDFFFLTSFVPSTLSRHPQLRGDGKCVHYAGENFLRFGPVFLFRYNWEGKTPAQQFACHCFSEATGPQLPELYSQFYCTLQIGTYLTTPAFNWEIIKKPRARSECSPSKCCPCPA